LPVRAQQRRVRLRGAHGQRWHQKECAPACVRRSRCVRRAWQRTGRPRLESVVVGGRARLVPRRGTVHGCESKGPSLVPVGRSRQWVQRVGRRSGSRAGQRRALPAVGCCLVAVTLPSFALTTHSSACCAAQQHRRSSASGGAAAAAAQE
jgi:hypothetical protein